MSLRFFVYRNTIHSKADYEKTLKTFKDIEAVVIADNEKNPRNGDQPLSSVLSANGWFPDTPLKKTVGWLLDYDYGVKSALISSRHYAGLPEENEFVTDSRGLKGIIDYLAQNITSKIKTEKVVTQIKMTRQTATGSQLQVREPGASSRFDFNLELERLVCK